MSQDAPHYGPMTEQRARDLLGECVRPDGRLLGGYDMVAWQHGESSATLDGQFTADELEAIAWWMRNKA
jgi:hypothetical protein